MTRETADLGHHLYEGLHILQDGALQLEKTDEQDKWKKDMLKKEECVKEKLHVH